MFLQYLMFYKRHTDVVCRIVSDGKRGKVMSVSGAFYHVTVPNIVPARDS